MDHSCNFINYYDNYRIMITPTYYNYVDYLYIRYIPNGINFPIEDVLAYLSPDINSLIIGVDIDELINVDTSNENEIIIQGTINQNSLIHYKNVLKCFDYISDDIQRLANIAIYINYVLYPKSPKNFCWDLFGYKRNFIPLIRIFPPLASL